MEVSFSNSFKKSFKKNIQSVDIDADFWIRLEWFIADPFDSRLRTHKLSGKLNGMWSFSLDYNLRVVFFFTEEKPKRAVFVDIGNHDQVY
jgi:mRNA-degrading endonuclease YafQ of YafQ-DinJ toxin-antitoxin module